MDVYDRDSVIIPLTNEDKLAYVNLYVNYLCEFFFEQILRFIYRLLTCTRAHTYRHEHTLKFVYL